VNEELWKKVLLILGIFFTALFTLTPFVYMIIYNDSILLSLIAIIKL